MTFSYMRKSSPPLLYIVIAYMRSCVRHSPDIDAKLKIISQKVSVCRQVSGWHSGELRALHMLKILQKIRIEKTGSTARKLICCGYRRLIIYKQSDALYIVEHAQLRRVIHRFLFQIHYSLLQRKSLGNESFQRVGDVEVRFLVANLLPSITSNSFPIKWHFILCDSAKANNTVPWWLDYLINKFEFVFFEFNSR